MSSFESMKSLPLVRPAPVSPDDELISVEHGQAIFAAATEPKRFLELEGGHNERSFQMGRAYADAVDAFLTECLNGPGEGD